MRFIIANLVPRVVISYTVGKLFIVVLLKQERTFIEAFPAFPSRMILLIFLNGIGERCSCGSLKKEMISLFGIICAGLICDLIIIFVL